MHPLCYRFIEFALYMSLTGLATESFAYACSLNKVPNAQVSDTTADAMENPKPVTKKITYPLFEFHTFSFELINSGNKTSAYL